MVLVDDSIICLTINQAGKAVRLSSSFNCTVTPVIVDQATLTRATLASAGANPTGSKP